MTKTHSPCTFRLAAKLSALAFCAVLSTAAAPPKKPSTPSRPLTTAKVNWNGTVATMPDGSARLGNPNAKVKLVEFVSYTCSHCADFNREADPALRLTGVPQGTVSVTVTNFLRNPIDATAAMLVNCGDPKRFFVRHNAVLGTQKTWLAKLNAMTPAQRERWSSGTRLQQMRAIASDFGFYTLAEGWGISRAHADVCLADEGIIAKLKQQQAEVERLGLEGTPSFTINGDLVHVHDWPSLSKLIDERLKS